MINFPITSSRYSKPALKELGVKVADKVEIFYGMQLPGVWRFVVSNPDLALCGPQFKTKGELLAALPDYAITWGF